MDHYVKVGASHTPSQTHLPLTSRVATHTPLGAQPRSDRILRLPCGRLGPAAPYMYVTCTCSMTSSARVPQLQPVGKQERSKCAIGLPQAVGEEAHSRQRHGCLWSEPVNVETWRHVPDPIVMAHAFAELRYVA